VRAERRRRDWEDHHPEDRPPATPTTGKARVYVDSTSKNLAVKSSDGVVKHGVQTRVAATSIFLTGIADDGSVTGAHPAATDLSDATAAGLAMFQAASVAAQQALLGLGPFATSGITLAGDLFGVSTGSTLTGTIAGNAVTYAKMQQASANVLLGHGPGGFVPLATLSTPVPAGTTPRYYLQGTNTTTTSTRGYVPANCTLTFLEVDPQSGVGPTVSTVFTVYKNGSPTAATVTIGSGQTSGGVIFSASFGTISFNGTTDVLDIVGTPSAGGGGAWNVIVTVGADTTGAPGDVTEIPCTDAGRAMIAATGATAQAELLAQSIASWGRGVAHNTSVPPSGSWTPDGYTSTTGFVSQETGGGYLIHGLTGGTDGRIVVITCATSNSLSLVHEDAAATAADRFYSPACSITAGQSAILRYSGALSRWVTIGAPAIYPGAGVPNIGEVQFNYLGQSLTASPGLYGSTLVVLDSYDTLGLGALQLAARIQQKLGSTTASANDLTLPGHNTGAGLGSTASSGGGNTYTISGTTTINRLNADGWQAGSKLTLVFSGSLTVAHKGASASGTLYPISLRYGASMLTTAGDTLDIVFDGALWQETGRRAA